MQHPAPRYAIYFTPDPLSPLACFGAGVIGYDPATAADLPHLNLEGISASELVAATEAPRKYGFHATLVAPFHLGDHTESRLLEGLDEFCSRLGPVQLGPLRVSLLDDFIALIPRAANPSLDELACHSVEFFDAFRAPLGVEDLARRNNGRLSARQRAYLDRWGYPYVFEDFRFHMTLTGPIAAAGGQCILAALVEAFGPLADRVYDIDALSLMRQRSPDSRFEVIARRVLRDAARRV